MMHKSMQQLNIEREGEKVNVEVDCITCCVVTCQLWPRTNFPHTLELPAIRGSSCSSLGTSDIPV